MPPVRASPPNAIPYEQPVGGSRGACGSKGQIDSPNGNTPNLAAFVFIPWICLTVIMMLGLLGSGSGGIVWAVFILLVCISLWYAGGRHLLGHNDASTAQTLLAMLCLIACAIGLIMALDARGRFLKEYWRVDQGASYFNILPADDAGGRSDATAITFANGTRVDMSRTYGYLDVLSGEGKVYCVAPIADANTAIDGSAVQFWAVGVDCCYQRSQFDCEDSANANARGGIVIDRDSVDGTGFQKAVEAAEYAYGIRSSQEHVLMQWVLDPSQWHARLWSRTLRLFLVFATVYLVFSCMIGFTLTQAIKQ